MAVYEPTDDELQLANNWHSGQSSMLYAIASTGALTRGTRRPSTDDGDGPRPMTDEEWSEDLLWMLTKEVREIVTMAEAQGESEDAMIASEWYDKLEEAENE